MNEVRQSAALGTSRRLNESHKATVPPRANSVEVRPPLRIEMELRPAKRRECGVLEYRCGSRAVSEIAKYQDVLRTGHVGYVRRHQRLERVRPLPLPGVIGVDVLDQRVSA